MTSVAIGALRHRVTLEATIDTPDDAGGFTRVFAPLAQLWAAVEAVSARADFVAERQEQMRSHRVTIRWRSDVASGMRFDFRGRKLLIRSVIDADEKRRFLKCQCEEIN